MPDAIPSTQPAPAAKLKSRYAGVTVAMTTPCTAAGDIDYPALRRCTAETTSRGADGVFVVSSTGGMPFLDEPDRLKIIAAARETCPRHKTLYAGISGMGVPQVLRYARQAASEGADAAVIMSPFFLRLSQSELLGYFSEIADACPIPLCLYHHVAMPTPIEIETVARFAHHPNVVALKDTSGDLDRMHKLVDATRDTPLILLQGNEPMFLPTLQAGGHGCVSALAGIAPEWHRDLQHAFTRNNPQPAEHAQHQISTLWKMFQLPQMKQSFSYFARSLALAVQYRGWSTSPNTVVPHTHPDPAFDAQVLHHLTQCGLPAAQTDHP